MITRIFSDRDSFAPDSCSAGLTKRFARLGFWVAVACGWVGCLEAPSTSVAEAETREFLKSVSQAQIEANYQGLRRRVQMDRDKNPQTSRFLERVFHCSAQSDGTPERHLVELELIEDESQKPAIWAEGRIEQLKLGHRVRSNFIERYRELRIGDVELLFQNYVVTKTAGEPVLGRPCALIDIKPRHATHEYGLGRGHYQLWIDEDSYLPLRTKEFAVKEGRTTLIGESEFLNLEKLEDPDAIKWPDLDFERTPIEDGVLPEFLAGRNVGFPPSVKGFKTARRDAIRFPGTGTFLLHFMSDGLEPLLLLQGLPELPARLEVRGTDEGQELINLEILEVEFGRTIALVSTYDGVSTYLIGKGSHLEMRQLFEKLFQF